MNFIELFKNTTLFLKLKDVYKGPYILKNKYSKITEDQYRDYLKLKKEFKKYINEYEYKEKKIENVQNKIWVCWLQGMDNAPDIVKACFNSLKENILDYEIVLIDSLNIKKYTDLPDYIWKKYEKGIITNTHFSDLVRLNLLNKWGGCWIDSTVLCTSPAFLKIIKNEKLFVYKQFDLSKSGTYPIIASSWFIKSDGNSKIISLTYDLLLKYWKIHNYLISYYLIHLLFSLAAKKYDDEWKKVPSYNNHAPHTMMLELGDKYTLNRWEQMIDISDFHKLNRYIDIVDAETFYFHIIERYNKKSNDV